ncbi:MAG: peptidylprolyl isomerase [Candidatus Thiodiazotropha lotti]|uniref:Chaperone SurA n=1 Tax=Candidatus Thiodiazotropha endoloripes TaxID=1818881 RepID=A0A1E2UM47_9GAMM|nr:peptidylprolyl isomerase [Candidatus Thiodiazotropha endoloripes]MCG7900649.1 peptidylprolyl isomerase [Candidatus Thiodiazotropha weberae]MCG7991864.1 peptidylprolyl isomerase [Candidatus Thiodiazotropha lotti]MCG7901903.1 peptidylprolyl isomerase [Candidatus Thiodiazotropha weberae]MCG7998368.1 peptidylprolyl isomerase [Candidatus Thiodiazotropha lotti]MCW4183522.1 peptidylprolyl isomerase [Candidatus Thiodiazotropha weberae]
MSERFSTSSLLLLLCLLLSSTISPAAVKELDYIVAIVNDDVIAKSELDNKTREMLAQMSQKRNNLPPMKIIQEQILERMIAKRLQLQAANRLGLSVDDATVTKAIANIAETNNITLLQLRETLEADGIRFPLFREQLREDILINRLKQKEVINRIVITEQDIKNFLAREMGSSRQRTAVRLLHILIATPEGASPQDVQAAKKRAMEIHQELLEGGDFSELAIRHSDGRQALEGGDLGWVETSRIPSLFTSVVDEMEADTISTPIRNASGFHIVKLAEVKGGQKMIINQTHARHILINTNEIVSDDEARQRLETLRTRIINGDGFETLARSHSDDKASAIKGGDLGWTSPGDLVPQFEEQMNAMAIDQISQPFKTQFGWHIVQPLERRQHDSTEEVLKNKARQEIQKQKSEEAIELWLRRLRDEAYVEVLLEELSPP